MSSLLETDTVVRAVRTFAQAFVSTLLVLLPTDVAHLGPVWLEVLAAAGFAGLVGLLSFVQNELEDAGRITDRR